jgi:predicted ATPase
MIQRVTISNFRALQSVDVEVRPLTVLVGPNDSGKSSFLDAIYQRLSHSSVSSREDHWRLQDSPRVQTLRTEKATFEGSVEIFKLPSEGIPMESSGIADRKGAPQLHVTGSNLSAFLDYLLRKDRRRFDQIQDALRDRVPGFEEIRIGTPSPESRSVSVSIEAGFEIPGRLLSTGVRMLFFFVALAHHPQPPDVVLIEEPETGVHLKRLKDIVGLLRSLTTGKLGGKAVQVFITTHSPYLLDHITPPEDQVIVFRRLENGRRTAQEADPQRLKAFLDEFMLGEVWFNQGEEGLVTLDDPPPLRGRRGTRRGYEPPSRQHRHRRRCRAHRQAMGPPARGTEGLRAQAALRNPPPEGTTARRRGGHRRPGQVEGPRAAARADRCPHQGP